MICWYVYWEDNRSENRLDAPYKERMRVFLNKGLCGQYVAMMLTKLDVQTFIPFQIPTKPGLKVFEIGDTTIEVTCLEVTEDISAHPLVTGAALQTSSNKTVT